MTEVIANWAPQLKADRMQRRRLDFSYLVRSGLGIPDYWHPHLEIQRDFQAGKIARYPLSMDIKADYPGQLNDEGVPIVFLDTMCSASPVTVILYGLGSHDAFLNTGNDRYLRQMMRALHWLENHRVALDHGIGWPYPEDLPVYGLKSPWFSAVVQGFALSLLVRAIQLDSQGPWRGMAHQTWCSYHVPIEAGGFSRKVPQGVVYEEYPAPDLNFVFNGMCFALIGLWEAQKSGIVPAAREDFGKGVQAARALLPCFTRGSWSLYSLSGCLGKPLLASPYYQRVNGLLAQIIGLMTGDSEFSACGERWLKYGQSFPRRAAMSLRIGIERFLYAPALLQRDKARN
jgi:heparosan-N-sulfate-glucuronate 5-epimerase